MRQPLCTFSRCQGFEVVNDLLPHAIAERTGEILQAAFAVDYELGARNSLCDEVYNMAAATLLHLELEVFFTRDVDGFVIGARVYLFLPETEPDDLYCTCEDPSPCTCDDDDAEITWEAFPTDLVMSLLDNRATPN